MRRPAQGATGSWVMSGFVSSGFLCVSSHYLILPRVSSLVVQGLGVSAPTPKAQGLILVKNKDSTSGLLWHYVRLKQIYKNKKPKMNPRQMAVTKAGKKIIKLMEYTPMRKVKIVQKNKIQ